MSNVLDTIKDKVYDIRKKHGPKDIEILISPESFSDLQQTDQYAQWASYGSDGSPNLPIDGNDEEVTISSVVDDVSIYYTVGPRHVNPPPEKIEELSHISTFSEYAPEHAATEIRHKLSILADGEETGVYNIDLPRLFDDEIQGYDIPGLMTFSGVNVAGGDDHILINLFRRAMVRDEAKTNSSINMDEEVKKDSEQDLVMEASKITHNTASDINVTFKQYMTPVGTLSKDEYDQRYSGIVGSIRRFIDERFRNGIVERTERRSVGSASSYDIDAVYNTGGDRYNPTMTLPGENVDNSTILL